MKTIPHWLLAHKLFPALNGWICLHTFLMLVGGGHHRCSVLHAAALSDTNTTGGAHYFFYRLCTRISRVTVLTCYKQHLGFNLCKHVCLSKVSWLKHIVIVALGCLSCTGQSAMYQHFIKWACWWLCLVTRLDWGRKLTKSNWKESHTIKSSTEWFGIDWS